MKVIKATQQMLETRTLVIGFQGENLRTQLRIDCSPTFAEYPNATPALAIKPPTGETYPVFVERDGNEVVWDIVANNLALKGDGELQLTFYKDSVIAKTSIGHITVNRSLQIDGEMPDVVATWIENANRKLAEVDAQIVELEGMVDTATDAATRAEQSESNATDKAEQAAGSAATATEKATEATNAEGTATAKATEAALSATQASNSAMSAANSESGATAKAAEAAQSAQTATTKAGQATEAAQTATEKAGDASASATAAHASEINAAESADNALSAEVGANAAKRAAETSATQASISEQNAGTAAQTATQKAAEANQSASNAATSATNAATSAETASTKAGEAAQSAQAVEETAEQLAESLEQISQNTADIAEHEQEYNALKEATLIHSTASGAIASFTDGAEMPVDSVTCEINPVQDLHGYDHPWPAGGGKNLLPFEEIIPNGWSATSNGVTATYNNGVMHIQGTHTASGWTNIVNLDTRFWSGFPLKLRSGITTIATPQAANHATSITLYAVVDGTNRNLSNGSVIDSEAEVYINGFYIAINGEYDFNFDIPMIVEAATTRPTAFSPYSNICPITGWDGVKVTRTGKNIINPSELVYSAGGNNVWYGTQLPPDTDFVFSTDSAITGLYVAYSDADEMPSISGVGWTDITFKYNTTSLGFNSGSHKWYRLMTYEINGVIRDRLYQLELGSTATDYEPYAGQTYDIAFPSEAGTVYGGSLTIAEDGSGVLTVDRAIRTNAQLINDTYTAAGRGVFVNQVTLPRVQNQDFISPKLLSTTAVTSSQNDLYQNTKYGIAYWWSEKVGISTGDGSISTYGQFKEWLAENGMDIVYPLVTPITYTLTASQITTLLGENHLWHDANGDISVGYKANTKLYVDGKIAELVARIVNS